VRTLKLLAVYLVVVLVLGATATSAAAHKKVLVLKEEGQPVPVGTELGVELEMAPTCIVAWRGHMSVNDASSDKVTLEPVEQSCTVSELYPSYLHASADEVEMIGTGREKASIRGSFRWDHEQERPGPYCEDESMQLKGHLKTAGLAQMRVAGHATLVRHGVGGGICHKRAIFPYVQVTVLGHNGKPLETELMTPP